MADTDLNVHITGDSRDAERAFNSAERSARVFARELERLELRQRQMATQEAAAYREQARRAEQATADARAAADATAGAMEQVGTVMAATGTAIGIGLGIAVKAASDWQSAWAGVAKTVDGTDAQMGRLEDDLRRLATTLPATHEEIAAVAEAAGQLGVRREDIAGFTKTMIDLGVATNLSADEAATGLAQLGNVMGVLPDQAGNAGAALVALGNAGASTESDILAMSLRIAGAGRVIGLTEDQVMAIASALSSLGIEAEAGGSSISRVMVDMSTAVQSGSDKLALFARVAGMSVDEFATLFREDAAHAMTAFTGGLGRMQASGADTFGVLDKLGLSEIRVRDTLLRTASAGDLLNESLATGGKAWSDNTALVDEASRRYQTAESRVAVARNQLNDTAIDIGAVLLPVVVAVADRVGALAEAFRALPDGMKASVTILGAVAAAALAVGGAALIAIPKIKEFHAALLLLGPAGQAVARGLSATAAFLGGPWGLAVGAAVVALGIIAEKHYEAKKRMDELTTAIQNDGKALGQNAKAWMAHQLAMDGTLDAARRLGLNLQDVTTAALGDEAATGRLRTQLDATRGAAENHASALAGASAASDVFATATSGTTNALHDAVVASDDKSTATAILLSHVGGLADMTDEATGKIKLEAQATGAATDATEANTGATDEQTQSYQDASKAVDALGKSLDSLYGSLFSVEDATDAYHDKLNGLNDAVKKNGSSIDGFSDGALANRDALRGVAEQGLKVIEAMARQGATTEDLTGATATLREQFKAQARQAGFTEAAVEQYAKAYDAVPGIVSSVITQPGMLSALTNTGALKTAVQQVPRNPSILFLTNTARAIPGVESLQAAAENTAGTYDINFRVFYKDPGAGSYGVLRAEGGILDFYAAGGMRENHVAQIAPAGSWRVWAEPETGGEAYIPLAEHKRGRSLDIWRETGRRLGASYFADGGMLAAPAAASVGDIHIWLGDRELTDIVRVEVAGASTAQARQLAYGRRP